MNTQLFNKLLKDASTLSTQQLYDEYGIEVQSDKSVWDPIENKHFTNLREWVDYTIEQDDESLYGEIEKISSNKHYLEE